MANTQAIANSFRVELLNGIHAFGTTVTRGGTGADTFKAALFFASATVNASTTTYSATGEATGTGYSAGGVTVAWSAPANTGSTAYTTPSANIVYSSITISTAFDAVEIYNSTQGNKTVGVWVFGSQTITGGTLTLQIPTNDATTGLIRLG